MAGSIVLLVGALGLGAVASAATRTPTPSPHLVQVSGPTIIAFSPVIAGGEAERLTDQAIARDDFEHYLGEARPCLLAAQIAVQEIRGSSLRIRESGRTISFDASGTGGGFGFYLKAQGRKPQVLAGVQLSEDLVIAASGYFGIPAARFQPCTPVK